MAIELLDLPFSLFDLEPYISRETMEFHYGKHHAKYVETLNQLIKGTPYDEMPLEDIVLASWVRNDRQVFNNSGQAWNHAFFWDCLTPSPKKEIPHMVLNSLNKDFGSLEEFLKQFKDHGLSLFGSGWVWLVKDEMENFSIMSLKDAENPLVYEKIPLLVCDVWEHAYYIDYRNERGKFLDSFLRVINWDFVEMNNRMDMRSIRPLGSLSQEPDLTVE